MSKALVNAYALMRCHQHPAPKLVLVCPGYCDTDLTSHYGTDPPAKGAQSVLWAIFHPEEARHGHLYQHGVDQALVQEPPQQYRDNMRQQVAQAAARKAAKQQ